MKSIVITGQPGGQWLYTVYVDGRPVVVGVSSTRERAESAASLA